MNLQNWFMGVVEDDFDPEGMGRVKVRCFGYHDPDHELLPTRDLPYTQTIHPVTAGSAVGGNGTSPTPLLNSIVFGAFYDGNDTQDALILGTLPGGNLSTGQYDPNTNFGFGTPDVSPGRAIPLAGQPASYNAGGINVNIGDHDRTQFRAYEGQYPGQLGTGGGFVQDSTPGADRFGSALSGSGSIGGSTPIGTGSASVGSPISSTDMTQAIAANLGPGLRPYAADFVAAGSQYGLDPRFLASISKLETANGTSSAFRYKNNAMGISDARGPIAISSVRDSIFRQARTMAREGGYYSDAYTISQIGSIYAPPGAGNDPRGTNSYWPKGVSKFYREMGGDPNGPVKGGSPIVQQTSEINGAIPFGAEERTVAQISSAIISAFPEYPLPPVKELLSKVGTAEASFETDYSGGAVIDDSASFLTWASAFGQGIISIHQGGDLPIRNNTILINKSILGGTDPNTQLALVVLAGAGSASSSFSQGEFIAFNLGETGESAGGGLTNDELTSEQTTIGAAGEEIEMPAWKGSGASEGYELGGGLFGPSTPSSPVDPSMYYGPLND